MKKMMFAALLLTGVVALSGCSYTADTDEVETIVVEPSSSDEMNEEKEKEMEVKDEMKKEPMLTFSHKMIMKNVSNDKDAKGEGVYGVNDGETRAYANFMVEDPADDFFYEGWLVCGGKPFSTGVLEKFDGLYENYFISSDVPTSCQKYVLTIEPNDNDPAPAAHVFDATLAELTDAEKAEGFSWEDERFETTPSKLPFQK